MINYNKNIPKFTTIKELVYHSATVFSNNIAFTTKQKKDDNITYISFWNISIQTRFKK